MEKIKILYIITKSDVGGAQKYVADLAGKMPTSEFDARILYGGKDIRWLSNKLWPWALFLNDWLAVAELIRIFRKERPDIIHLNSSKAGIIGSLAGFWHKKYTDKNLKVVFTAHGWVFNPTNALISPVRWIYIALHKLAAYFQDAIICVSEYDYALALRMYVAPREKLHTIHNGIISDLKFLNKEKARGEILNKLKFKNINLKRNNTWIGSVGRLVKEKNYETFIDAAKEIPDAYFFIIGDGPEEKKLKDKILNFKLQDRFFLVNPSGEDFKYLKAFDIFVMSSIKEGLPYILLEAMAAELPIVVTEAGGIPEIIKSHENGMMIAQKNPHQLAQAIHGLIANPQIAAELKKTAKHAVHESFSLQKMVNKTEAVYKSLKSESL